MLDETVCVRPEIHGIYGTGRTPFLNIVKTIAALSANPKMKHPISRYDSDQSKLKDDHGRAPIRPIVPVDRKPAATN